MHTLSPLPLSADVCWVQNTLIEGNVVVDRGAGIFVESAQAVVLSNVTITGNVAGAQARASEGGVVVVVVAWGGWEKLRNYLLR